AFLPDGRLMVGGDAGAIFFWDGQEWESTTTGAANEVQAVGHDRFGNPIAADSRGLVHRSSGARWQMIGQVPDGAIAIADSRQHGLMVIGGGARIHATLYGESFVEMPGYDSPIPQATVLLGAHVLGDDVLFWQRDGLYLFD